MSSPSIPAAPAPPPLPPPAEIPGPQGAASLRAQRDLMKLAARGNTILGGSMGALQRKPTLLGGVQKKSPGY